MAALVESAAPAEGSQVVQPQVSGREINATVSDQLTASVSRNPDDPIVASTGAASLEIYLPEEAQLLAPELAGDGSIAFEGEESIDVVTQALTDGSLRIQTISDAAGGTEFTYRFGDSITLRSEPDGSVRITEETPEGAIVEYGRVDPPWATDANGAPVETHYEVDGNTLIQTIAPNADTVYPVVADPKLTFGWRIYWSLTRTEQAYFAVMTAGAAVAALCGATAGLSCIMAAAAAPAIGYYVGSMGGLCPKKRPWLQIGFPYGYPAGGQQISMACKVRV